MNPSLSIRSIMTTPAVPISPETTVAEIEWLFSSKPVLHLPVMGNDGRLIGMVSKSDLQNLSKWTGHLTQKRTCACHPEPILTAAEIMIPNVIIVLPDDTLANVCSIFSRHPFQALPVVDSEGWCLAGTISMSDLLRYVISQY